MHTAPACPLTVIAWRLGGLTLHDLWWQHLTLGGMSSRAVLAEYLHGATAWPTAAHNVLAQTLNEALWDLGCPSVAPYRNPWDVANHVPPEDRLGTARDLLTAAAVAPGTVRGWRPAAPVNTPGSQLTVWPCP